jgi:hypothetical protein
VDAIKGREVFREDSLIALGEFSVEGVSECEMIVVCLGSCPYYRHHEGTLSFVLLVFSIENQAIRKE